MRRDGVEEGWEEEHRGAHGRRPTTRRTGVRRDHMDETGNKRPTRQSLWQTRNIPLQLRPQRSGQGSVEGRQINHADGSDNVTDGAACRFKCRVRCPCDAPERRRDLPRMEPVKVRTRQMIWGFQTLLQTSAYLTRNRQ